MSKAILVVDMPDSCSECCFCRGLNVCRLKQCLEKDGILSAFTVDKQILDDSKPYWCPLRELPQKMQVCGKYPQADGITPSYKIGYNACIDEILKGAKKNG